ncbi:hypothetical protein [Magnetospirillum moscoviense]|uniref:Uncharacterized protein n=1 Tax=Magnetospirillum moscoviense TaxID=1437059 RepID=A0A178MYR8_9PROT|nr:hypothetical protein [Magnetospirillum moscoviense]OAN63678.1 hypothetical protein A6A05_19120 [Magnetospirillum moscoviense]
MAKDDNKIAALAMIQGIIDSATELAAVASAMEREPAQPDILFAVPRHKPSRTNPRPRRASSCANSAMELNTQPPHISATIMMMVSTTAQRVLRSANGFPSSKT